MIKIVKFMENKFLNFSLCNLSQHLIHRVLDSLTLYRQKIYDTHKICFNNFLNNYLTYMKC